MSRPHEVIFDIRSGNVAADFGLVAIELTGETEAIEAAVKWLRRHGMQVDPI